jgi:hypothetical protein
MKAELKDQIAGFTWNPSRKVYQVEVCGYIVAEFKTIKLVESFSEMHHAGFLRDK